MDPLSVANLALSWLGCDRILGFIAPSSRNEQLVHDSFDGLRDAVLEEHDWTFAIARYRLPKSVGAPAFGYRSRFELPPDVLRVIACTMGAATAVVPLGAPPLEAPLPVLLDAFAVELLSTENVASEIDWQKEGRFIVTEGAVGILDVTAVVRVADSSQWSPAFAQVLAARLAAELALPITQDRALQSTLWTLYETKLKDALASDGRQGRSRRIRANALARRRW